MKTIQHLPESHSDFTLEGWWVLPLLLASLFIVEWVVIRKCDPGNGRPFLRPFLLTYLPWLLILAAPAALSFPLPPPHDFAARKLQILFGLMLSAHLFLFCGWLLERIRKDRRPASRTFGLVSAFFFLGMVFSTSQCDLSGDEPHYLLMAHSLIQDLDLNLLNNYGNRDYEKFYHRGTLIPQGLEHITVSSIYSHHPLGPVLVVLPGFLLLGRLGAALTMALLAALALYLTLRALEEGGARGWSLLAVGAIGLFSSPLLLFSGLVFPEIPTACLAALSLLLFSKRRWGWFGAVQGLMLWMHNRNVLLVAPLLLFAAFEVWRTRGERIERVGRLVLGFMFPAIALMGYFYYLYGVLSPLGAHNEPFTSLFRLSRFWDGFLGLLLDQECGLWFHFPIFAVAATGAAVWWRSRDALRFPVIGTFLFYYLFMSFYENLGLTPAARYMVGVTPLLLMMIHPALERIRKWDVWAVLTLLPFAAGALVNWLLAAVPWMRYNKLQGENWMLKIAGDFLGLPLAAWEPAFHAQVVEPKSYIISAFWVGATVVLTLLFLKTERPVSHKG